MLKEYLEKTYGYNEPIFLTDLTAKTANANALRQSVKRMVKSGTLLRFDTGIYYLPKASRLLNKSYLDPLKVIVRKYIQNNTETFGYFTGATFANQLGVTTQMPAILEIATNKEATKGRLITIGNQKVRLKRPALEITSENAPLLQFLEAFSQIDKYAELSGNEVQTILRHYIKKQKFSRSQLLCVVPALTGTTAKKLIEGGLIYDFTP
ncbi:hypothetical protein M2145_000685 [Lachnospiraceae bacterium PF1-21]|uniref:DUF6088 family protein n=1 Tax=Ohessyouella blattaphilus TaxID=2949333 RepID=A0ABT1EDR6_9FIRM|nr:DUF6088 family protein [Ohessyouella blattaphilus]MCP1108833.1 DUF6088 family protein [Ohessyouella blattaphilus]MCR8562227.1 DUF6088 family protein [Ohessyouella blattaphilus]MDL2249117.1 DUF6088 family protein [Lachnospiraceae bacterium OttesenSCG-928-J05]